MSQHYSDRLRRLPCKTLVWNAGASLVANATNYLHCYTTFPTGGVQAVETHVYASFLCTRRGTIKNLVCYVSTAHGAGNSSAYTVYVNGLPTAITCTISGAVDTKALDITNFVAVSIGNRISLRCVTSAAGLFLNALGQLEFEGV